MAREVRSGAQPRSGATPKGGVALMDPPATRSRFHGAAAPVGVGSRSRTSDTAHGGHSQSGGMGSSAQRFGIDESNLATRREFIRLGEEERTLLAELAPWAQSVAAAMAKDFYDWQFEFGPTRRFFESYAQHHGMSTSQVRQTLERAQAGYLTQIFDGAEEGWGVDYFERRLKVGAIHDKINLPFKWYIGSYSELQRLTSIYLRKTFKEPKKIGAAEQAIFKVFNYDIQAIGDAFLMNTFESMGLSLDGLQVAAGADKTEHVDQIKEALGVMLQQAEAIASGDLENSAFDSSEGQTAQGELAISLTQVRERLQSLQKELARLTEATREGQLSERGKPDQFQGVYSDIVKGLNEVLDAILLPIAEGNRILGLIQRGNLREKFDLACKGDHDKMKQAVNGVRDWLTELVAYVTKIANGDMTASMAMASDQDQIHEWLVLLRSNIGRVVSDGVALTQSMLEGQLTVRADAARHQGDFRKLIEGFNETLDAILLPIGEGNRVLAQVSAGKIDELIAQTYKGDHEKMKQAVNNVAIVLQGLQRELERLTEASKEGQLSERGKPDQFQGAFAGIVKGVNEMLDAILLPIGEGNRILGLVRGGNLREKVEIACKGDHEKMKQAVNGVHEWLSELVDYITKIANGDMTASVTKASDKDQIHEWLLLLKGNINALVADTSMMAEAAADGRVGTRADSVKHQGAYRAIVQGINQTLEAVVQPLKVTAQNATALAAASEELTAVSQQMAGNAEETATQANVVSAASEEVSKNVASVASASEEMQASIREIAKNVNESARVAKNAVSVAHSTNETVRKLGESSQEIGNVIKVITSIAQQTNLLALNATIEAARAGEAGKGFAVVANEVKELAKQTAKATGDIGQKIDAIQADTKGAVKAIEEISNIINQINDISNSIASAVEEQTVTTNEIGRSVTEASQGVSDIAKNIGGVAVAAKNTTQGANDTQKASQELSQMAARLQMVVSKFTF